jgi:hypothetical protein
MSQNEKGQTMTYKTLHIIMQIVLYFIFPDDTVRSTCSLFDIIGLGLWCLAPFQQYFSYIFWKSALLVGETSVREENHRPVASLILNIYYEFILLHNFSLVLQA